jgi:hypothetical protein
MPSFLRRLIKLNVKVFRPTQRITLNRDSLRDSSAWLLFADRFNGRNLLSHQRWIYADALHLHTDSAGSIGYGSVISSHWFHGLWPVTLLSQDITFMNLFPMVAALEL